MTAMMRPEISNTKRRIMTRAAALFAEHGFGGVGISQVGEAAGLGKGALYHHIGSKEDLLYVIMTDYMTGLIASARQVLQETDDTRQRVHLLSRSFMDAVFTNKAQMIVCFRESHSLGPERRQKVLGLHADYQRIWEQAFADGARRGDCSEVSRLECKALLGMYFYSFLWVRRAGPASSTDIANDLANIVMRAITVAGPST